MVTVEYHDPSGIFATVQPNLLSRLPLRSLKWKSPTRPLRNIETLHVDFVPDTDELLNAPPPELQRRNSVRSGQKGSDVGNGVWPVKHSRLSRSVSQPLGGEKPRRRRHQIPGLRETPYLKLFILRCDDKEHYRTTHRNQLRDWVKAISAKTSKDGSSALDKHDNHDAYEWMIIHIVVPGTPVASEPRWTAAKNDPDELAERSKSKTKWTSKGSSTVFDKLRADFHPPSKTELERVAQIRLDKNDVPAELMPVDVSDNSSAETPQEQENAWQDLIGKFKILILQSFDARVAQYEEDVRAKEAQRSLPGWNFCTFFVLKEGLARAFENVGLLEDALAVYDELEAGLDSTAKDSTAFFGDMASLRYELISLAAADGLDRKVEYKTELSELLQSPLGINLRDFRDQILSSNISLFDFHIYIFTRQRILIYRLGSFEPQDGLLEDMQTPMTAMTPLSAATSGTDRTDMFKSDDQLTRVADVCRRATAFISTNTQRFSAELVYETDTALQESYDAIVQNVVASWAFNIAEKVLAETAISLTYAPSSPDPGTRGGDFAFNRNNNSLLVRKGSLAISEQSRSARESIATVDESEKLTPVEDDNVRPAAIGSGLADLAAHRGELFALQRRFLELLASKKGWRAGWAAIERIANGTSGTLVHDRDDTSAKQELSLNFLNEDLMLSLVSEEAFRNTYGELTDIALRHLTLGNRSLRVEGLYGDLALLRYQLGDMAGALQMFQKLTLKWSITGWDSIKSAMLWIYTRCLRALNRKDDYIRYSLNLLKRDLTARQELYDWKDLDNSPVLADKTLMPLQVSLCELVEYSKNFAAPFRASLTDVFHTIQIAPTIRHDTTMDGFMIGISFTSPVHETIVVDAVKVKLLHAGEQQQDIWLRSGHAVSLLPGRNDITLATSTSTFGLYTVQEIVVEAGMLHFATSFEAKSQRPTFSHTGPSAMETKQELAGPIIMVYPRSRSLVLKTRLCPEICIDKQRSLLVTLSASDQPSKDVLLRLKPATAGLRLHMAEAHLVGTSSAILGRDTSNALKLSMESNDKLLLMIPFSLEGAQTDLLVHAEVTEHRDGQEFVSIFDEEISNDPLIDVDVNDIFKRDTLFSRFTLRTTSCDPLLLHGVDVEASAGYTVECQGSLTDTLIFHKQPVSLVCRLQRKGIAHESTFGNDRKGLTLQVRYSSLLADLIDAIMFRFEAALETSVYFTYARFLIPTLRSVLNERISSSNLEEALLLHGYEIPSYSKIAWDKYTHVLPAEDRPGLLSWLEKWHKEASSDFPLRLLDVSHGNRFVLTIPVEVPCIEILASVTLKLDDNKDSSIKTNNTNGRGINYPTVSWLPRTATVGQRIPAKLEIIHSRKWSATAAGTPFSVKPSAQPSSPPLSSSAPADEERCSFTYTIVDSPDWLIAGPTRATFSAAEHEPVVFPLLLIPLVPGVLLLPQVELRLSPQRDGKSIDDSHDNGQDAGELGSKLQGQPASAANSMLTETLSLTLTSSSTPLVGSGRVDGSDSSSGSSSYACEVDFETAAETVLVLRPPGDVQYRLVDGPGSNGGVGGEAMRYMTPPPFAWGSLDRGGAAHPSFAHPSYPAISTAADGPAVGGAAGWSAGGEGGYGADGTGAGLGAGSGWS